MTARSKAWVCGRSRAGTAGCNPAGGLSLVNAVCCAVRGLCLGLITPPEEFYRVCCVSGCDRESSIMRRPRPTGELLRHGGGKLTLRMSSIQSLAAHRLRIAAVTKDNRIVYYLDVGRRQNANGKDRTERKPSKFLDLRPTTPKHEMFYHFKSHLSM